MTILLSTIYMTVLLVTSCLVDGADVPELYVQIFSHDYFSGNRQQVNLTRSCNSVANFVHSYGTIESINTKGNCVNVYEDENCSGRFTILKPGNPFHFDLDRWNCINRRARAIGLCHPDCHETRIESTEESVSVEVFRKEGFQGTKEKVTVEQRTCSPLSEEMKGVITSMRIHPEACIELHEFANCSGYYRDFPVGSVSLGNLKNWDWSEQMRVESISFCGYRCNHTDNQTETNFSSYNFNWIIFIVSLSIVVIILLIFGASRFIKLRYGNSSYRVMFQRGRNLFSTW